MSDSDEEHPQILIKEDDSPVNFFLHSSLSGGQHQKIERDITRYGGNIVEVERKADTIIADWEHLSPLNKFYAHSTTVYVEDPGFVKRCINAGSYSHTSLTAYKRNMGGATPGIGRNLYTYEEDKKLAEYIAKRIPDEKAGGRFGVNIYKELCDPSRKLEYPWAKRHSWQSWRERYRSNSKLMNDLIDDCLKLHPPPADHKGEHLYDRRYKNGPGKRPQRKKAHPRQEEYDSEGEESDLSEGGRQGQSDVLSSRKRRRDSSEDLSDPDEPRRKAYRGVHRDIRVPTPENSREVSNFDSLTFGEIGIDLNGDPENLHEQELLDLLPNSLVDISPRRFSNTQRTLVGGTPKKLTEEDYEVTVPTRLSSATVPITKEVTETSKIPSSSRRVARTYSTNKSDTAGAPYKNDRGVGPSVQPLVKSFPPTRKARRQPLYVNVPSIKEEAKEDTVNVDKVVRDKNVDGETTDASEIVVDNVLLSEAVDKEEISSDADEEEEEEEVLDVDSDEEDDNDEEPYSEIMVALSKIQSAAEMHRRRESSIRNFTPVNLSATRLTTTPKSKAQNFLENVSHSRHEYLTPSTRVNRISSASGRPIARTGSDSSVFPGEETRARRESELLLQRQKMTPYTPASGSRAEQVLATQKRVFTRTNRGKRVL